jgi:hypothetical protein
MSVWIPLLLADPSSCLRLLVLRELLHRSVDDPEVAELTELRDTDPLATELLARQQPDGSWESGEMLWSERGRTLQATALALTRLGYLGFGPDHPVVQRGVEYLFARQQDNGSWPLSKVREEAETNEGYSMVPLQTAIPLRALAACGYAADPRAERAYKWLSEQRLPDGGWPTGIAAGNYGRVAGYRRLAHSRWACRSNTTGALSCLTLHPTRRTSPEARRALELLLGRETREQHTLGFEIARLIGIEPVRGFLTYYARFDLAQVLDFCWRVGATLEDQRVAGIVEFVRRLQGSYGLWEYTPHPQVSRWVTFDLLRSLSRLDKTGDWLSLEPRTPFQPYTKQEKRY